MALRGRVAQISRPGAAAGMQPPRDRWGPAASRASVAAALGAQPRRARAANIPSPTHYIRQKTIV